MSLQMPAPTSAQKASRTRTRHQYSSARAFYLTILVISAIAILSSFKHKKIQHDANGADRALFSRPDLTIRDGLVRGSGGELVPRHQAVCWNFFGINHRKDFHEAHNALHSADSLIPRKTNALSSAPTAQMRKRASFPTYNSTTASCTRLNLSP